MPVFLERFVLPALAAALIGVILLNPFKLDWQQQVSLAIVVVGMAFFVGYTVQKANRGSEPQAAPSQPVPQVTGPAQTSGDSSPANTGSGNSFNYDQSRDKK